MVELFQTTKQNVSLHLNNLYKEGELKKEGTVKEYLTVQSGETGRLHPKDQITSGLSHQPLKQGLINHP